MSRKALGVAVAVVLLTVLGAVAVPALAELSTDERVIVQNESTNGSATCNYTDLYRDTSPGVVQVMTDRGQGSGFVYELDNGTAYVVTNQHVVAGGPERTASGQPAEQVDVRFSDGATRTGNLTGTDVYTDLAVARVDDVPESAAALPVADEGPPIGERVAAIGSPFGLEGTMTHGIISGVNRSMPTGAGFSIPDTVQTDAPINPGNSGGPLVTCEGEVVGVNRAGGGDNVGFAISPELVERVVPALIEEGNYSHPYLGIRSVPVTSTVAEANDLNASEGVMVIETTEGGPADGTLRGINGTTSVSGEEAPVGGDVIVAVDGREIASQEQLGSYLATETSPGDEIELTVIRDGDRTTVTVTLGERPAPDRSR
ncbi:PDZ domain-containing protein [Halostella sp. JP-L12]|uniref:S1C family serine protease n=1 Tax=Halostella TaxID=1843185 RepID=UPI000EF82863|nr:MULTISPECIES: trypsin-like peptidase domain-containing protein [Halostella]NHN48613.1 PDZ domain-containing protein [Halostella sp. JP-L12]